MRFTGRNLCHTRVILVSYLMSWKTVRLITQIKKFLLINCLISTKTLQKPDISTLDNYAFRKEIF